VYEPAAASDRGEILAHIALIIRLMIVLREALQHHVVRGHVAALKCAFDLLELDGEDYRAKPLAESKKALFKLLRRAWRGIEYVEHLEGDGAVIFEHACKLGLEGIVCKRIDCPMSKSWNKVKNKAHPAILRVKEAFELERQRSVGSP
jgi:ATP-dependent DNA ligase